MTETRYKCLICKQQKDFSLVTLYEHLNYHLKDKGITNHFEYKCVNCEAYFTNRVFMICHKMEPANKTHKIERLDVDLINPQENTSLVKSVTTLTKDYLRFRFCVAGGNGASKNYNLPPVPGTPPRALNTPGYMPHTPIMSRNMMTPPRMAKFDTNQSKDFSNCFANATPSRMATPTYDKTSIDDIVGQLLNPDISAQLISALQAINNTSNIGISSERKDGYSNYRDNFDFNSNDGYRESRRGGVDRSPGRDTFNNDFGKERDNFRGRGGRSGRGGFRGSEYRGRGRGGNSRFGDQVDFSTRSSFADRERNSERHSRSTSRSPHKRNTNQERRSYSRSRSRSNSPDKKVRPIKKFERRSYSRSPQSD